MRDLSESALRYLLVPGWALRDGHLARLLLPALRAPTSATARVRGRR